MGNESGLIRNFGEAAEMICKNFREYTKRTSVDSAETWLISSAYNWYDPDISPDLFMKQKSSALRWAVWHLKSASNTRGWTHNQCLVLFFRPRIRSSLFQSTHGTIVITDYWLAESWRTLRIRNVDARTALFCNAYFRRELNAQDKQAGPESWSPWKLSQCQWLDCGCSSNESRPR